MQKKEKVINKIMGFFAKVYEAVKQIPSGKVATYGQIAKIVGEPKKARIVGWALHSNPNNQDIPCHRVVNRKGELSGGYVFGGPEIQKQLLEKEGIEFVNDRIDLKKFLWSPN